MPGFVFTDARVEIDGTVLSAQVRAVTLTYSVELLDASAMGLGATATRQRVAGLLDWTLSVDFNQNFAVSNVDEILYGILIAKVSVQVKVRPTSAVIGTANPEYNGFAFLESYPPFSGGVAEIAVVSATFQGDGVLNRATS